MTIESCQRRIARSLVLAGLTLLFAGAGLVGDLSAQQLAAVEGEWPFIGGDAAHTRYAPLDQIDASNFADLQLEWVWRGDNFGPSGACPTNSSTVLNMCVPQCVAA